MSNFLEKVADLTTVNIMRTTRAMFMNFCIVNTPRCQVKGNIMKRQKTSALKHFSLPKYSKKWTAW